MEGHLIGEPLPISPLPSVATSLGMGSLIRFFRLGDWEDFESFAVFDASWFRLLPSS
jgi:hypothetical protein